MYMCSLSNLFTFTVKASLACCRLTSFMFLYLYLHRSAVVFAFSNDKPYDTIVSEQSQTVSEELFRLLWAMLCEAGMLNRSLKFSIRFCDGSCNTVNAASKLLQCFSFLIKHLSSSSPRRKSSAVSNQVTAEASQNRHLSIIYDHRTTASNIKLWHELCEVLHFFIENRSALYVMMVFCQKPSCASNQNGWCTIEWLEGCLIEHNGRDLTSAVTFQYWFVRSRYFHQIVLVTFYSDAWNRQQYQKTKTFVQKLSMQTSHEREREIFVEKPLCSLLIHSVIFNINLVVKNIIS